ncbi:MAG: orotate phosphoribosyltransferase [Parachlamydiales bacterium]|nr:orotate phosphoribosyltransferase [Verrucomicrobiota bacterium]MBX3718040.1 orotate phosphoribosyltransferase [Candidatus Acheromyda pituitae]
MQSLILDLHEIQAVKFGNFTLKSGIQSPIYIDLRVIISYPHILKQIADMLWKKVENLSFDLLCGVPYTALPIATAISIAHEIPMVMRRKESKDYGTKKIIEGVFQPGQTCLIVEDVITSGASIIETLEPLNKEGLKITDAVVVLNREQGGEKRLAEKGVRLHSLLTISDLVATLQQAEKITTATAQSVREFLASV